MMRAVAAVSLLFVAAACTPTGGRAHTEQEWAACQGETAFQEQRMAACSAVIADARADINRRSDALVLRGVLRGEIGEHARAVADFGRALRLNAENVNALVERGLVHQNRGAYDVAIRDYEAALAIDPRSTAALNRRDIALQGRVDAYAVQISQLDDLLFRDPLNAEALNNRCWIRAINDYDLNAALADCDAAVRIAPRSAAALDSRGLVRLKRGDFEGALSDYEAALVIEPGRGHYIFGRGVARSRLGRAAESAADLQAAEAAEPGVTVQYRSYGIIL